MGQVSHKLLFQILKAKQSTVQKQFREHSQDIGLDTLISIIMSFMLRYTYPSTAFGSETPHTGAGCSQAG